MDASAYFEFIAGQAIYLIKEIECVCRYLRKKYSRLCENKPLQIDAGLRALRCFTDKKFTGYIKVRWRDEFECVRKCILILYCGAG